MAIVTLLFVCTAAILLLINRNTSPEALQTDKNMQSQLTQTDKNQEAPVLSPRRKLKNDLEVLDVGDYTGIYMEDGTDELVTGILMMKIVNNGEDTVEYARFTMEIDGETAEFTLSTLKPGETVVLLEKNRMAYDKTADYASVEIVCENLALFREPLTNREDKLRIQILDGAVNVINISDEDIPGHISIYYKNKAAGIYYGGITYRITLENGLKAGEICQMMASHFSDTGSEIVFVTIAE